MEIFRKVGDWIAGKSDRFIRGEAPNQFSSDRLAFGQGQLEGDDMDGTSRQVPIDPFGHSDKRTPYRSRQDREREEQEAIAREQEAAYQAQQAAYQAQQAAYQAQQQAAQQGYQQQQAPQQPVYSQPQPQQAQPQQGYSNVVPFPGMQQTPDGRVYAHEEYITLLRNREDCCRVIKYIKTNASVFLNMEFIASDSERQRCVDMLSGAVYTLGCSLNKISPRGIYLISSPSVRVIPDPEIQKFSASREARGYTPQPYEAQPEQPQQQQPEAAQPVSGFGSGSPTTRFQTQSTRAGSFGSVMAGGMTASYPPVQDATGRYAAR